MANIKKKKKTITSDCQNIKTTDRWSHIKYCICVFSITTDLEHKSYLKVDN